VFRGDCELLASASSPWPYYVKSTNVHFLHEVTSTEVQGIYGRLVRGQQNHADLVQSDKNIVKGLRSILWHMYTQLPRSGMITSADYLESSASLLKLAGGHDDYLAGALSRLQAFVQEELKPLSAPLPFAAPLCLLRPPPFCTVQVHSHIRSHDGERELVHRHGVTSRTASPPPYGGAGSELRPRT
jgi:hypothetical protein